VAWRDKTRATRAAAGDTATVHREAARRGMAWLGMARQRKTRQGHFSKEIEMTRIATVTLESTAAYSQGRPVQSPRGDHENHDAHEERTWRERIHQNAAGEVFIPPMGLYHALCAAARFRNEAIKGQGKKTYTKRFESGVLICEPLMLGIEASSVPGERLFVPSDGKSGGGKRVWRIFPLIAEWRTRAELVIADDLISEKVFRAHLEDAGRFIGLGRFRPERRGFYGRFQVSKVEIN
jgi:hypothetical protein